jgi:hypothetical protein
MPATQTAIPVMSLPFVPPILRACWMFRAPTAVMIAPNVVATHACAPGRRRGKKTATTTATAAGTATVARFDPSEVARGASRIASSKRWTRTTAIPAENTGAASSRIRVSGRGRARSGIEIADVTHRASTLRLAVPV